MPADCPFMGKSTAAPIACEPQCMPKAQTEKTWQAQIVLAPPTALFMRCVVPPRFCFVRASPPLARNASPPLSLLFGRFLI
jgi:hypothetical protein